MFCFWGECNLEEGIWVGRYARRPQDHLDCMIFEEDSRDSSFSHIHDYDFITAKRYKAKSSKGEKDMEQSPEDTELSVKPHRHAQFLYQHVLTICMKYFLLEKFV